MLFVDGDPDFVGSPSINSCVECNHSLIAAFQHSVVQLFTGRLRFTHRPVADKSFLIDPSSALCFTDTHHWMIEKYSKFQFLI